MSSIPLSSRVRPAQQIQVDTLGNFFTDVWDTITGKKVAETVHTTVLTPVKKAVANEPLSYIQTVQTLTPGKGSEEGEISAATDLAKYEFNATINATNEPTARKHFTIAMREYGVLQSYGMASAVAEEFSQAKSNYVNIIVAMLQNYKRQLDQAEETGDPFQITNHINKMVSHLNKIWPLTHSVITNDSQVVKALSALQSQVTRLGGELGAGKIKQFDWVIPAAAAAVGAFLLFKG